MGRRERKIIGFGKKREKNSSGKKREGKNWLWERRKREKNWLWKVGREKEIEKTRP